MLQLVEAADRHGRVAGHRGVHIEPVPGPAQPHIFDAGDARHRTHRFLGLRHQTRVNAVQQSAPDITGGAPQQNKDGDADDDRIGRREAEPDSDHSENDRQ